MSKFLVSSVFVLLQCFSLISSLPRLGCTISVNEHLVDPQPLVLLQNDATEAINAFPMPQDNEGTLVFTKGETIDIACPGSTVIVGGEDTRKNLLEAKCKSGTVFMIEGKSVPFNATTCKRGTSHKARYTGNKCGKQYREIEIGFQVSKRFIKHIITCYDNVLQHAIYAQSTITSNIGGSQINYPRPGFKVGSFYNVKPYSVNDLYSQNQQRITINKILNYDKSNTSIIKLNSNYYLATGHFTAKADFVYGTQQRLTFYYVNSAPQWQTFNGGNWNTMESNCRTLAIKRNLNLTVYTGSYGISTLPDKFGNEQELYLWISDGKKKGIPIPALFYKVIYEPESEAGVAILGVNNPYKKNPKEFVICKDVCNKIRWLSWNSHNVTLGYGYCCEVNDFRKTVKDLPPFTVKSLLV